MIKSKSDLKFYLKCDEMARGGSGFYFRIRSGKAWTFHKCLRKAEYYLNCRKDPIGKLLSIFYKLRLKKVGRQLGWSVPPNVFGPGLCIVHIGTVVVNGNARIGANCRIQACVNIGASGGRREAPKMGDNVYIGPGAKIFGDIKIGSYVAIGANAVVNKSFEQDEITIAGIPAKIISNKGSKDLIIDIVTLVESIN